MTNIGLLHYNKIVEENIESSDYHNGLIDLICLQRWRLEGETIETDLHYLKGTDSYLELNLPNFRRYLSKSLLN